MRTEELLRAVADESVAARYRALVCQAPLGDGCMVWMGAISGKGHGRFWVRDGLVVIAHRFGFALAHGVDALANAPHLAHICDEASCQNPEHLRPATASENTEEWWTRRESIGNPLRDIRGARGRALALRAAARANGDLAAAATLGLPEGDRLQDRLW